MSVYLYPFLQSVLLTHHFDLSVQSYIISILHFLQATYRHLFHKRKMDPEQNEKVKQMLQMKANRKLVQQHIKKETGVNVLLKDLHNLCGKQKGAPPVNLEAVVNELKQSKKGRLLNFYFNQSGLNQC